MAYSKSAIGTFQYITDKYGDVMTFKDTLTFATRMVKIEYLRMRRNAITKKMNKLGENHNEDLAVLKLRKEMTTL